MDVSFAIFTGDDPRVEAAYKIRYEVFVVGQQVPLEIERDEYDLGATHLLATGADGAVLGTLRMVSKDDGAVGKIGRVAVLEASRGRGLGSAMMRHIMAYARQEGFGSLYLHAQVDAADLYRRLGFVDEGELFYEANIPHIAQRLILEA